MCALHSGLMRRTRNDPFAVDVAVAQLEERSLLMPHDLGSNPSIIDSCTEHLCTNVKKHEAKTEKNECWDQLVGKIMFQISWFCSQTFVLFCLLNVNIKHTKNGLWCGSVGRAVASDTRGSQFKSSHPQNLLNICLLSTVLQRRK